MHKLMLSIKPRTVTGLVGTLKHSKGVLACQAKPLNLTKQVQCMFIISRPTSYVSHLNFCTTSTLLKNKNDSNLSHKFSSNTRYYSSNNDDDLQRIWKDKSLGLFAKFKILFKQYGPVVIVVHLLTAAVWIAIFYITVSRGIDVVPILEKYGVLNLIEKIPGMPSAENMKNSGAKDLVLVYLLYEIFKPIRYIVTIFGSMFAIRYLRKINYLKRPPKMEGQIKEILSVSNNILQHRMKQTANKYRNSKLKMRQQYEKRYKNFRIRTKRKNGR